MHPTFAQRVHGALAQIDARRARLVAGTAVAKAEALEKSAAEADAELTLRRWRFEWRADVQYLRGDGVHEDGSAWLATADNIGKRPSKSPKDEPWTILARKGDRGLKGDSGQAGKSSIFFGGGGSSSGVTEARVIQLIELLTLEDFDAIYLDDQVSAGAMLTFTFDADVQKVWVKLLPADADDTSTARVRVDGGDPDSDTGTQIEAGVPQPITAETSVVKVLAPAGKTVNVYGYRRKV